MPLSNDSVTGISSTVEPSAHIEILGKDVDELSLTFVTPLRAEDDAEF